MLRQCWCGLGERLVQCVGLRRRSSADFLDGNGKRQLLGNLSGNQMRRFALPAVVLTSTGR